MSKKVSLIKGWGREVIWASNYLYCGKFLEFSKNGKSSMHFHANKSESWYIKSGEFEVSIIDTTTSKMTTITMTVGDTLDLPPLTPHQVRCVEEGVIIEVSTYDDPKDNYRVMPGDSQNEVHN